MSFSIAENAIRTRFTSEWNFPSVPVFWQNEAFTLPPGPCVVMEIIGSKEDIVAFGGGRGRNELRIFGMIRAIVLMPIGANLDFGRTLRDRICEIFRWKHLPPIRYLGASPVGGSDRSEDGRHFSLEALVEFEYRYFG